MGVVLRPIHHQVAKAIDRSAAAGGCTSEQLKVDFETSMNYMRAILRELRASGVVTKKKVTSTEWRWLPVGASQ